MKRTTPKIFGLAAVLLTMLCCHQVSIAQIPTFRWARMMVGDQGWFNPISMAIDHANGVVYIAGSFMNTVDLDPGPGSALLSSTGSFDAYIQKLDTNGNFIWARALTGTSDQFINTITVDLSGNVTYAGVATGTTDFDLGLGVSNINLGVSYHAYVSKINSAGNLIWARSTQHGATQSSEVAEHYVDAAGNTYSTGKFEGTVDFDPGVGTTSFTSGANSQNFIQKLDASGNFVWARSIGGTAYETAYSVWVTPSGDVIATGQSDSPTIDLDPGAGTANFALTSPGALDLYIQKLNSAAGYMAGARIGGPGGYVQAKVTTDLSGNIIVMGYFLGTIDMDPGPGTFNISSNLSGNIGAYVAKYTPTLGLLWAKALVGTDDVDAYGGIYADATGSIYVSGGFTGTCDFDPGPGSHVLNVADVNGYLLKLDPAGNFQWVATKTGDYNYLVDFAIDYDQAIYGCGSFNGVVDFDPQATTFLLSQPISNDVTSAFKWTLQNTILSAEDISLIATPVGQSTHLEWQVSTSTPWARFEVYRSSDGSGPAPIHSMTAAATSLYQFQAPGLRPGHSYQYQVKGLTSNGDAHLSEIVEVTIPTAVADLTCQPNPASDAVTLHATQAIGRITLLNTLGQVVMEADAGTQTRYTLDLHALPSGMYTLIATGRPALKIVVD